MTARFFRYALGFGATAMLLFSAPSGWARPPIPAGTKVLPNLVYKQVNGRSLMLDLFLPADSSGTVPLIIYIHGGAWEKGSRHQCPAIGMTATGFAVASIDYRLSQEAPFPAQIEDCKAAIRWLRAHASEYHLDPDRFGVWGTSAGGHLAALVGTTGGVKSLEGDGGNLQYSSRVQAVCAVAAPSDLTEMNSDTHSVEGASANPRAGLRAREAVSSLLGGPPDQGNAAAQASPITYVSKDDPPFLLIHGAYDRIVPLEQSRRFEAALKKAGVHATLKILPNEGHQGSLWSAVPDAETFFQNTLKNR